MNDTQWIDFNMNNDVKVKLTDYGKQILADKFSNIPGIDVNKILNYIKVDSNGYYEFQLWDLMSTFGEYLYNGCKLPFETNIKFSGK